jgi:hypothetical protein
MFNSPKVLWPVRGARPLAGAVSKMNEMSYDSPAGTAAGLFEGALKDEIYFRLVAINLYKCA